MHKWIIVALLLLISGVANAAGEWYSNISGSGSEVHSLEPGETAYYVSSGTSTTDSNTLDVSRCPFNRVLVLQSSSGAGTGYVIETTDPAKTYTAKLLKDADFDGLIDNLPLDGNVLTNLDRLWFQLAIRIYIDVQAAAGSGETTIYAASCLSSDK